MTPEQDKIIERVKKLLALAEEGRGATPEEAAVAAAKAQALLFEHNLTMAAVEAAPEQREAYTLHEEHLKATRRHLAWHRLLLHGIAVNNFCKAIYMPGTTRMEVVGKPSNIEVVLYLYTYLSREIARLAEADAAAQHVTVQRETWKASFCYGATVTVIRRLAEMRAQTAAASVQSRALIVLTDQELDKAAHRFWPYGVRKGSGPRVRHTAGYLNGANAGRNIPLHDGVTRSGSPNPALLT